MYAYVAAICRDLNNEAVLVGRVADHPHILTVLPRTRCVSASLWELSALVCKKATRSRGRTPKASRNQDFARSAFGVRGVSTPLWGLAGACLRKSDARTRVILDEPAPLALAK
jgi:hypothetical protein